MSVLIKGMEMPKEKKITLTLLTDGRVYENYGERLRGYGEDCIPWKAVPVPPHGRCIDADALDASLGIDDRDDWVHWTLESAPTIIPAEEGE